MSTGATVGLVAALVLGGGAIAYVIWKQGQGTAARAGGAPPDQAPGAAAAAGDLPAGLPPYTLKLSQDYGDMMVTAGARATAAGAKDAIPGLVLPGPTDGGYGGEPNADPAGVPVQTKIGQTIGRAITAPVKFKAG